MRGFAAESLHGSRSNPTDLLKEFQAIEGEFRRQVYVSPDGRALVVVRALDIQGGDAGQVWWLPRKPGKAVRVYSYTHTSPNSALLTPNIAVSPDGEWLLYSKANRWEEDLVLWSSRTGERRLLTSTPNRTEFQPAWSPDGRQIAYLCEPVGPRAQSLWGKDQRPRELRLMSLQSGEDRLVLRVRDNLTSPAFSPEARRIAFFSSRGMEVVGVVTRKRRLIAPNLYVWERDDSLRWSPDGRWVGTLSAEYLDLPAGDLDSGDWLYLARADGKAVTRVTPASNDFLWLPDSSGVVAAGVKRRNALDAEIESLVVFDLAGKKVAEFGAPERQPRRIEWTHTGKTMVALLGRLDNPGLCDLALVDAASGAVTFGTRDMNVLAFSVARTAPTVAIVAEGSSGARGVGDVLLLNLDTHELVNVPGSPTDATAVTASADGSRFACLVRKAGQTRCCVLSAFNGEPRWLGSFPTNAWCIDWQPEGELLAVGLADGRCGVYDVRTASFRPFSEVHSFPLDVRWDASGAGFHPHLAEAALISPDGDRLVGHPWPVQAFVGFSGRVAFSRGAEFEGAFPAPPLLPSPDWKIGATILDGDIVLCNPVTGSVVRRLTHFTDLPPPQKLIPCLPEDWPMKGRR